MIFIASPKLKLLTVSKKIIHHVNLSNKGKYSRPGKIHTGKIDTFSFFYTSK